MSLPQRLFAMAFVAYGVLFHCMPIVGAPIKPFEAIVNASKGEDVYARSGPGKQYYPTQKMKDGDVVTVIRKDPGGWFVIEPPVGSFTWILADNVNQEGNRGVVNTNQSVTRVGSQINPAQRDVEQVRLNKGDVVEILGTDSFDLKGKGTESWLKIKSPRGERRWIKGSQVAELNPDGTPKLVPKPLRSSESEIEADPETDSTLGPVAENDLTFAPSTARAVETKKPKSLNSRPDPFSDSPFDSTDELSSDDSAILAARRQFGVIDRELEEMLDQPPYHWELSRPRDELLKLRNSTNDSSLMAMIDARLQKVDRYQVIQDDAKAVTSRYPQMQRTPPRTQPSPPMEDEPSPRTGRPVVGSRFEGAGIIYKLQNPPPGTPQFVLIAPDRRILCYLESNPTINLDQFVGQSMGLNGKRIYDARLRADRLLVTAMTPVRLAR